MTKIIKQQDETHVFINEGGQITIKQNVYMQGESLIVIDALHVTAICKALRECKSELLSKE